VTDLPDFADVVDELFARQPESDMVPTLDRVARVLELLGDPQESLKIVHVTGTNGKTSTSRMIEAMVRRTGLRTGLFTSPHLQSVTERIQVDGVPLDDHAFIVAYEDLRPVLDIVDAEQVEADAPQLTFFEVLTCLGYSVFADAPVDVAVIEVGLGGRWDATNVGDGNVAVITPIAIDHTAWLGSTTEHIATEKAGIIKAGAIAVIAAQRPEVLPILLQRCAEAGATALVSGLDFGVSQRAVAVGGQVLDIKGVAGCYDEVFLALIGRHQADNAALAVAAVESLLVDGVALDMAVVDALGSVISPGRLQAIGREPTVVVDAAHNPAGAAALAAALADSYSFTHLICVVGVMADKDIAAIIAELTPVVAEFVVTQNSSPRCAPAAHVGQAAVELVGQDRVHIEADLAAAVALAKRLAAEPGGGVVVTGSVVTAAEAMQLSDNQV